MIRKVVYIIALVSWFVDVTYMILNKWTFTEFLFIICCTICAAVIGTGVYTLQSYRFETIGYVSIVRMVAGNIKKMLKMTANNVYVAFIGSAACVGVIMLSMFMLGHGVSPRSAAIFFLCMIGSGMWSAYVSQKEAEYFE